MRKRFAQSYTYDEAERAYHVFTTLGEFWFQVPLFLVAEAKDLHALCEGIWARFEFLSSRQAHRTASDLWAIFREPS